MILFVPKSARSAPEGPGAGGEKGRWPTALPTMSPVVDEKAPLICDSGLATAIAHL